MPSQLYVIILITGTLPQQISRLLKFTAVINFDPRNRSPKELRVVLPGLLWPNRNMQMAILLYVYCMVMLLVWGM